MSWTWPKKLVCCYTIALSRGSYGKKKAWAKEAGFIKESWILYSNLNHGIWNHNWSYEGKHFFFSHNLWGMNPMQIFDSAGRLIPFLSTSNNGRTEWIFFGADPAPWVRRRQWATTNNLNGARRLFQQKDSWYQGMNPWSMTYFGANKRCKHN